jgi:hypothetical protein
MTIFKNCSECQSTMTLRNDYLGVHKALTGARQVDPRSALGSSFRELAETMTNKRPVPLEKQRGLMDMLGRKKTEFELS